jgi:hypothetical protein
MRDMAIESEATSREVSRERRSMCSRCCRDCQGPLRLGVLQGHPPGNWPRDPGVRGTSRGWADLNFCADCVADLEYFLIFRDPPGSLPTRRH